MVVGFRFCVWMRMEWGVVLTKCVRMHKFIYCTCTAYVTIKKTLMVFHTHTLDLNTIIIILSDVVFKTITVECSAIAFNEYQR